MTSESLHRLAALLISYNLVDADIFLSHVRFMHGLYFLISLLNIELF